MPEKYSAVTWTVADLISDVRREARIPDAEYSNTEILREANNAIWTDIAQALVVDQGVSAWGIFKDELTVSGDAVGTEGDSFALPSFASAEGILHVHWFDSSTDSTPERIHPLPLQLEADYRFDYSDSVSTPSYYMVEGGRIRLMPRPPSNGVLHVWYQARHPELVETSATLASIDTGADTITVDSVPAGWPTPTAAVPIRVDVYSAYGPHRYFYRNLELNGLTTTTYDYTASSEDETVIGQIPAATNSVRIALHGQCDYVQLPLEYRKALSQKTASYILRQIGDEAGANSMEGMAQRSIAAANNQFMPRTRGQAQRWINRRSPMRSGRTTRWGR